MSTYIKTGDWALLMLGGVLVCTLVLRSWMGPAGDRAVVRAGGKVFTELNL
ncbi:MAG: hypothetical protein ACLPXB_18860 [Thiobacillaceae bacterium]